MEMYEKYLAKLKKITDKYINENKYNDALRTIKVAADYLYMWNQKYKDDELENQLLSILEVFNIDKWEENSNSVIVYDGFGTVNRGLMHIYLKALCKKYKVFYLTDEKNNDRLEIFKNILTSTGNDFISFKEDNYVSSIERLISIISKIKPSKMVLYTYPSDVVGIGTFNLFKGTCERYLINLTDQAFWLGINSFDYCIEFRDYGMFISNKYREIELNRLIKLPFYPIINTCEFMGYPFEYNDKYKIIFSGGSLYKTLGEEDIYYHLVDRILEENCDVIFWYAGNGDCTKLRELQNRHLDRVFFTNERRDLFEIYKHCDYFLNTFPISGGLMLQYAAITGTIPFTLKFDDECRGVINEEIEKEFMYDSVDDLCKSFNQISNNDKPIDILKKKLSTAVISEKQFEENLYQLLDNKKTVFSQYIKEFDVKQYQELYKTRNNFKSICLLLSKKEYKQIFIHFPFECLYGYSCKFLGGLISNASN